MLHYIMLYRIISYNRILCPRNPLRPPGALRTCAAAVEGGGRASPGSSVEYYIYIYIYAYVCIYIYIYIHMYMMYIHNYCYSYDLCYS